MGAVYETIQDIPFPGEHEAVVMRLLDGLGPELRPDEGALVVGSFANDAWDAHSDLDVFAHTPVSRKRAAALKEMAAALAADSNVILEFHAIYAGSKLRQEGGYQNHVRISPRWNRTGLPREVATGELRVAREAWFANVRRRRAISG